MRNKRWVTLLLLTALTTACTLPPRPAAPIGNRVLIPTQEPVTAAAIQKGDEPQLLEQPPVEAVASPLTPAQATLLASLPSRGAAPELDNATWFNTEPLRLADLQGKVVMVEFWTYG